MLLENIKRYGGEYKTNYTNSTLAYFLQYKIEYNTKMLLAHKNSKQLGRGMRIFNCASPNFKSSIYLLQGAAIKRAHMLCKLSYH